MDPKRRGKMFDLTARPRRLQLLTLREIAEAYGTKPEPTRRYLLRNKVPKRYIDGRLFIHWDDFVKRYQPALDEPMVRDQALRELEEVAAKFGWTLDEWLRPVPLTPLLRPDDEPVGPTCAVGEAACVDA